MISISGVLRKMPVTRAECVQYTLDLGGEMLVPDLNAYVGTPIRIRHLGVIHCLACGVTTPKSWGQGHCSRCFFSLASCDQCQVRPETCAYSSGQCREPQWGETHCFIPHTVYLANSSGLKVGITRTRQREVRWMDQGASQALPLFQVSNRLQAGRAEVLLKQRYADRTDWRALLKGDAPPLALLRHKQTILDTLPSDLDIIPESTLEHLTFRYPIISYPDKAASLDLLKTPVVESVLRGIKGQYLLLEKGAINIRKHGGFCVEIQLG